MQPPDSIRKLICIGMIVILAIVGLVYSVIKLNRSPDRLIAEGGDQTSLFTIHSSADTGHLTFPPSAYPIDRLDTYHVSVVEGVEYDLTVASYKDEQRTDKRAIIYLPPETGDAGNATRDEVAHFRYEKWQAVFEAINTYTDVSALLVSFWDNSQRINLFTRREGWSTLPDRNAYSMPQNRRLWESIAGGFDTQGRSALYTRSLLMDMDTAISELTKVLPDDRDTYLVVGTDDLSHIQEMAILTGQSLPLETRLFPRDSDVHGSIARVKEWARQDGAAGSYLVQPVSNQFTRVWRITDSAFEETLLARLLPFSSSFDKPFDQVRLVYQSDASAYLSIYQINRTGRL